MELVLKTYQISFFTNNSDVTATPPMLSTLLGHLSGFSLLPMYAQEINPNNGEKKQMVIMTVPDQSFRVEFPQGAIFFHGTGYSCDEFLNKVEGVFRILKNIFPNKKANRLAIVNTSFYQDSQENYSQLFKKIFTHPHADPFEWENRIVERKSIDGLDEDVNCSSAVRRCFIQSQMVNNNNPIEVINFEVETNTIGENNSLRFDFDSGIKVLRDLNVTNAKLGDDLSRYTGK
ncbi:hypothetical protein [Pantoea ananatis]|uniref:hypothetical protein n=1 Tax=Pantoea ananas TaxID=553 RepID=UPI001375B67D|nr:hypothetical protein [Pantoea ananatis]NCU07402.1 hypothetical protein [Pantoea ananatis]